MNPGNPQILACPYCGKEKEVMTLLSGNTYGAEIWSDNKMIAPMLPEISFVQKCPDCGKYYIKNRQEVRFSENRWCFEQGLLTYPEMKDAFMQILEEGFQNKDEEKKVRMMLHQAYNDYYYRTEEEKVIDEKDKEQFVENSLWLIEHLITDDVLKAEFYRQIGDMEKAKETLDAANPEADFVKSIASIIREKLDAGEAYGVFRIA